MSDATQKLLALENPDLFTCKATHLAATLLASVPLTHDRPTHTHTHTRMHTHVPAASARMEFFAAICVGLDVLQRAQGVGAHRQRAARPAALERADWAPRG